MQNNSQYPLREIGVGQERLWISEEERATGMHIIGSPGEGKSKLLELLIRGDINAGKPVCLLDPSDNGDTAYRILRYCQSIGFKKVCLIDPSHARRFKKVPVINPFHYQWKHNNVAEDPQRYPSVAYLMDAFRTLYNVKDASQTPRIKKYLRAVLHCLYTAEMTLTEVEHFVDREDDGSRKFIFQHISEDDRFRKSLEYAYHNTTFWNQYIQTTITRLEDLLYPTLRLIFGSEEGINFYKMITEGWVILVNLDSGGELEPIEARLLGTVIVNEIIYAIHQLRRHENSWRGIYNLYVDEAGEFMTQKLARMLWMKRKSGLRTTIAHHSFSQFDDDYILQAVKGGMHIKIMFNLENPKDRLEMQHVLGYGGQIPPEMAAFANANLPKQEAIVRKAKQMPVRIKFRDVPDVEVPKKVLDSYILELYRQPFYKSPEEIEEEIKQRFNESPGTQRTDPKASRPGAKNDGKSGRKAGVSDKRDNSDKWKDVF